MDQYCIDQKNNYELKGMNASDSCQEEKLTFATEELKKNNTDLLSRVQDPSRLCAKFEWPGSEFYTDSELWSNLVELGRFDIPMSYRIYPQIWNLVVYILLTVA